MGDLIQGTFSGQILSGIPVVSPEALTLFCSQNAVGVVAHMEERPIELWFDPKELLAISERLMAGVRVSILRPTRWPWRFQVSNELVVEFHMLEQAYDLAEQMKELAADSLG
jgi:hypothetical protein